MFRPSLRCGSVPGACTAISLAGARSTAATTYSTARRVFAWNSPRDPVWPRRSSAMPANAVVATSGFWECTSSPQLPSGFCAAIIHASGLWRSGLSVPDSATTGMKSSAAQNRAGARNMGRMGSSPGPGLAPALNAQPVSAIFRSPGCPGYTPTLVSDGPMHPSADSNPWIALFTLSWLMGLTAPLFSVLGNEISGRDLILIAGGLFLVGKSAHEMHAKLEGPDAGDGTKGPAAAAIAAVLVQILVLDVVFSLDSVITAVGMASDLWVMITAMILSVAVMLVFAGKIGDFVDRHPTVKILALAFLLLIGVVLVAEGFGQHISKGYIYFAMAFALLVELLNMRLRKVHKPVHLHAGERAAPHGA